MEDPCTGQYDHSRCIKEFYTTIISHSIFMYRTRVLLDILPTKGGTRIARDESIFEQHLERDTFEFIVTEIDAKNRIH